MNGNANVLWHRTFRITSEKIYKHIYMYIFNANYVIYRMSLWVCRKLCCCFWTKQDDEWKWYGHGVILFHKQIRISIYCCFVFCWMKQYRIHFLTYNQNLLVKLIKHVLKRWKYYFHVVTFFVKYIVSTLEWFRLYRIVLAIFTYSHYKNNVCKTCLKHV